MHEATDIRRLLAALPGNRSFLESEPDRQTPVKTRYVAHGQQLLRTDNETTAAVSRRTAEKVLAAFSAALPECSVALLSDYAKGVLNGAFAQEFIAAARTAGKPVIVDPKGKDFTRYKGATLIKPNLRELGEATGLAITDDSEQEAAAYQLLRDTGAAYILVTRGAAGMMLAPTQAARSSDFQLWHARYTMSREPVTPLPQWLLPRSVRARLYRTPSKLPISPRG